MKEEKIPRQINMKQSVAPLPQIDPLSRHSSVAMRKHRFPELNNSAALRNLESHTNCWKIIV